MATTTHAVGLSPTAQDVAVRLANEYDSTIHARITYLYSDSYGLITLGQLAQCVVDWLIPILEALDERTEAVPLAQHLGCESVFDADICDEPIRELSRVLFLRVWRNWQSGRIASRSAISA